MRLSLIGMAGTGKSYWTKRLAEQGFRAWCCDEMIQKRLESMQKEAKVETKTMGEWMGFPFDPGYGERQSKYLELERGVLEEILAELDQIEEGAGGDVVVDTGGSVIYCGNDIMTILKQQTTIVYLIIPAEVREKLLKAYVTKPHPMLWQDTFKKRPKETKEEAMARCYPKLVSSRETLYERYADITMDYTRCRETGFGVKEFLDKIALSTSISRG